MAVIVMMERSHLQWNVMFNHFGLLHSVKK